MDIGINYGYMTLVKEILKYKGKERVKDEII